MSDNNLIEQGREICANGKHTPRGELLGRIDTWGLDVYQGSPQPWIDTLFAEQEP